MQVNNDAKDRNKQDSRDDLQSINGIGPAYARALDAAGIHRFADLARYRSAADLRQTLLESANTDVPLWKIEGHDWLGQARKLAQPSELSESDIHNPSQKASQPKPTTADGRRQQAGFSLFFDYLLKEDEEKVWQTRAYHDESGEEKLFSGRESEQWVSWILEKTGVPEAAALPEPELVFLAPPVDEEPRLDILAVDVRESRPTFGILKGELCAEVKLQLWGDETETSPAEYPLRLELYLVNLTNRATNLVASAEMLLSSEEDQGQTEMTFDFPETGRYELHTIALLLPPHNQLAVHQGPVITIIP
jgi:hypothetical protein